MSGVHPLRPPTIALADRELSAQAMAAVVSIRVQQRLSMPTLCEIEFAGTDEVERADVGSSLRVLVGDRADTLFTGEVTAVEFCYGPGTERVVRVRGYDLSHRLRKRRPLRVHNPIAVGQLASALVSDLGLKCAIAGDSPKWSYILQAGQSDYELLTDLARRVGLYLYADRDTLHVTPLAGRGPAVELRLGEHLLTADIEVNADPACRTVSASGWNLGNSDEFVARETGDAEVGRTASADAPPDRVGGDGQFALTDVDAPSEAHADAAARAELERQHAREVVLRGLAVGDPRLTPGARIAVTGVDSALSGQYALTEVNHTINAEDGFISELSTAPPTVADSGKCSCVHRPHGGGPPGSMTLAVITEVQPDSGRVRARLPGFADLSTDWMQVVMPGAGSGKGVVALPSAGDTTLVLLAGGDPRRGVVLGGLYGRDDLPAVVGDGDSDKLAPLALRTAGGQSVQLDDHSRTIFIGDTHGNTIELNEDGVKVVAEGELQLHSSGDMSISAPGRTLTLTADQIDFRRR